eukprot:12577191-Prorocentrum_lima.AAC.1
MEGRTNFARSGRSTSTGAIHPYTHAPSERVQGRAYSYSTTLDCGKHSYSTALRSGSASSIVLSRNDYVNGQNRSLYK